MALADAGIEIAPVPDEDTAPPEPEIKPARLEVAPRERLAISLPRAEVAVQGPATLRVDRKNIVVVDHGTVTINGTASVEAPICTAKIRGRARVSVRDARVEVRVFAGNAEVLPGTADCTVVRALDLKGAARRAKQGTGPKAPVQKTPPPSDLRQQVSAFRKAQALTNPDAAVRAWRAFLKRWPESPMRAEAARLLESARKGAEETP
jgi:hypothetical protein